MLTDHQLAKQYGTSPERVADWKREIALDKEGLRQYEIAERLKFTLDKVKSDFREMRRKRFPPFDAS